MIGDRVERAVAGALSPAPVVPALVAGRLESATRAIVRTRSGPVLGLRLLFGDAAAMVIEEALDDVELNVEEVAHAVARLDAGHQAELAELTKNVLRWRAHAIRFHQAMAELVAGLTDSEGRIVDGMEDITDSVEYARIVATDHVALLATDGS